MKAFSFRAVLFNAGVGFLIIFLLFPQLGRLYYPFLFREEIEELGAIYDLEPELIAALIHVESKFNTAAESGKGARGLMQIMPSTGAWVAGGLGILDFDPEDLFDPQVNLQIGCWYLASLREEFSSITTALAAYNAGRGNVKGWLNNGIWDGTPENRDDIPFLETRTYLSRIERTLHRYRSLYE